MPVSCQHYIYMNLKYSMTSITFRKSYFPLTETEICNALNTDYRLMQGPKAEAFLRHMKDYRNMLCLNRYR